MNDYIDFNRKYKDVIIGKISSDDYYNIKDCVEQIIDDLVDSGNIQVDDLDRFTEFALASVMSRRSKDKILSDTNYDLIASDISTAYMKYNEKMNKKVTTTSTHKFHDVKSNQEKENKSKKGNESKEYISSLLSKINSIFKKGTNYSKLTNDIYDSLLFDGYKDDQIVSGKSNKTILSYLRNKYFDIEYNDNFSSIFSYSKERTNAVFRENEKHKNISNIEKYFYETYSNIGDIAFRTALGLCSQGYSYEQIKNSQSIDNYIQSNINSEISRIMSIRNEELKQIRKQTKVVDIEELKQDFKKKAIAFAIAFGIFAADNIIYNAFHNDKKEDTKKTRKEPTTYSVNQEYKPGSYLEYLTYDNSHGNGRGK